LAQTEADIYAIDKLVKQYLLSGCPRLNLLREEPYATFFADSTVLPWKRLGRLLGLAAQLGPDNSHPDEYASIRSVFDSALTELLLERPWKMSEAQLFVDFFIENTDRLLFNATPNQIREFFDNSDRAKLSDILDSVEDGNVLTEGDLLGMDPYLVTLDFNVEYNICHAIAILSSFNNLNATMEIMEKQFHDFSQITSPNKIEFYYALLVYVHVLHDLPYDEERFSWWEEAVLRDWREVLLYKPGLLRGEQRGFQDPFDRVFEDGFSVVYPYGILRPSLSNGQ
jgi:hypothetical protein